MPDQFLNGLIFACELNIEFVNSLEVMEGDVFLFVKSFGVTFDGDEKLVIAFELGRMESGHGL